MRARKGRDRGGSVRYRGIASLVVVALVLACSPGAQPPEAGGESGEIGREEAIEIAREHVDFEPRSVDAERATEQGRPVWRVTFRGRPPGEGSAVGEFTSILVDRRTGEVVSLAMS